MISLITPTGGRPQAFALCEKWMSRQTYRGELEWIVVDDCEPETPMTQGQTVIRPSPKWKTGMNTQERNMMILLECVKGDKIFVIEDDDYYCPEYLEAMTCFLDTTIVLGEGNAKYYHIPSRSYKFQQNHFHASLCQTALTREALPLLKQACESGEKFFDIQFWRAVTKEKLPSRLILGSRFSVGIKGMPGRFGIGVGHTPQEFKPDPDLSVLRAWVGDDWIYYRGFFDA